MADDSLDQAKHSRAAVLATLGKLADRLGSVHERATAAASPEAFCTDTAERTDSLFSALTVSSLQSLASHAHIQRGVIDLLQMIKEQTGSLARDTEKMSVESCTVLFAELALLHGMLCDMKLLAAGVVGTESTELLLLDTRGDSAAHLQAKLTLSALAEYVTSTVHDVCTLMASALSSLTAQLPYDWVIQPSIVSLESDSGPLLFRCLLTLSVGSLILAERHPYLFVEAILPFFETIRMKILRDTFGPDKSGSFMSTKAFYTEMSVILTGVGQTLLVYRAINVEDMLRHAHLVSGSSPAAANPRPPSQDDGLSSRLSRICSRAYSHVRTMPYLSEPLRSQGLFADIDELHSQNRRPHTLEAVHESFPDILESVLSSQLSVCTLVISEVFLSLFLSFIQARLMVIFAVAGRSTADAAIRSEILEPLASAAAIGGRSIVHLLRRYRHPALEAAADRANALVTLLSEVTTMNDELASLQNMLNGVVCSSLLKLSDSSLLSLLSAWVLDPDVQTVYTRALSSLGSERSPSLHEVDISPAALLHSSLFRCYMACLGRASNTQSRPSWLLSTELGTEAPVFSLAVRRDTSTVKALSFPSQPSGCFAYAIYSLISGLNPGALGTYFTEPVLRIILEQANHDGATASADRAKAAYALQVLRYHDRFLFEAVFRRAMRLQGDISSMIGVPSVDSSLAALQRRRSSGETVSSSGRPQLEPVAYIQSSPCFVDQNSPVAGAATPILASWQSFSQIANASYCAVSAFSNGTLLNVLLARVLLLPVTSRYFDYLIDYITYLDDDVLSPHKQGLLEWYSAFSDDTYMHDAQPPQRRASQRLSAIHNKVQETLNGVTYTRQDGIRATSFLFPEQLGCIISTGNHLTDVLTNIDAMFWGNEVPLSHNATITTLRRDVERMQRFLLCRSEGASTSVSEQTLDCARQIHADLTDRIAVLRDALLDIVSDTLFIRNCPVLAANLSRALASYRRSGLQSAAVQTSALAPLLFAQTAIDDIRELPWLEGDLARRALLRLLCLFDSWFLETYVFRYLSENLSYVEPRFLLEELKLALAQFVSSASLDVGVTLPRSTVALDILRLDGDALSSRLLDPKRYRGYLENDFRLSVGCLNDDELSRLVGYLFKLSTCDRDNRQ